MGGVAHEDRFCAIFNWRIFDHILWYIQLITGIFSIYLYDIAIKGLRMRTDFVQYSTGAYWTTSVKIAHTQIVQNWKGHLTTSMQQHIKNISCNSSNFMQELFTNLHFCLWFSRFFVHLMFFCEAHWAHGAPIRTLWRIDLRLPGPGRGWKDLRLNPISWAIGKRHKI